MGLFKKNSINIDELAKLLANIVIEYTAETSSILSKELSTKISKNIEINARQEREILIFEMLSATRAISTTIDSKNTTKKLLDKFHAKIYDLIFESKDDQRNFEKLIEKRYQSYYKILSSNEENMMFHLGKQFSSYLLNKESSGNELILIISSAKFFVLKIKKLSELIIEALKKFELKE